jgi:ribosomal protein L37AE/L43A
MTDAYAGPAANGPSREGSSRGSTGRSATPFHCPFCGDEDLRPAEDSRAAWTCRSCARVFTVSLLRLDQGAIPSNVTATEGGTT